MRVRVGRMLTIEEPTKAVLDYVKHRLILPNPDYEKKSRMGFWMGNTPRFIHLYAWVDGRTLQVPYGCLSELKSVFRDAKAERVNEFRRFEPMEMGTPIPLFDYQRSAADGLVLAGHGVLKAAAGSGKTQTGLAVIQKIGGKALWLCHTLDLVKQSYERAKMYMPEEKLGLISEGRVRIGEWVTFATVQTMSNIQLNLYEEEWDTVIVDECHHCVGSPAKMTMFSKVLNSLCAPHKFGLTATVHRADGLVPAIFAMLGTVAVEVSDEEVGSRILPVRVVPVETELRDDFERFTDTAGQIVYTKLIAYVTAGYHARDLLIIDKLIENRGKSCLILSERKEQLRRMMGALPADMAREAVFVHGGMTGKAGKAEREAALEKMRTGEMKYLFATYKLAQEGLDIPRLERLFMASPVKDETVTTQAIGRIARVCEGKGEPICYDFVDSRIAYLRRMWGKRVAIYRKRRCLGV